MRVSPEEGAAVRRSVRAAMETFRLPFRSRTWRGRVGNWSGAGVGSSIDFQDHRPYVPGDDPRYIDWQAYARSDHYVMKLYREEVSPSVEVVFDGSRSMSFDDRKRRRSLEALTFAIESARSHASGVTAWISTEGGVERASLDSLREGALEGLAGAGGRTDVSFAERLPFRPGSLRVLVTDGLFAGAPGGLLRHLARDKGTGVVLAPSSPRESDPDWRGHLDLEDCETGLRRLERIDEDRRQAYRDAYRRHFQLWEDAARRYGVAFCQLPANEDFGTVLRQHALPAGAVEPSA